MGDEFVAAEVDEADANNDPDSSEEASWDDNEEVNPNKGLSFSAPASVEGEVLVPYNKLSVWEHHPAAKSRTRGAHFEALCASANDPGNIPPLEIIRTRNGDKVINGRFRWLAIGAVHGATSDVGVRCLVFNGSEKQALEMLADSAVGTAPRTEIEQARAIYNLQRVAGDSQKAIVERYPVLNKDKVSRMTIAARTVERYASVFNLLAEPDRVSIDTCVKFNKFMKSVTQEVQERVLETAEARASEGISLKASELFDALGIEIEGAGSKPKTSSSAEVSDILESIDIFGEDDTPVGVVEKLDERVMRFQLPDPSSMSPDQREVAAQGYIRQILDYFGLKGTA